jgi:hypothetical protein
MDCYPCGVCHTDCSDGRAIACDICNRWLHYTCENISNQEFLFLKKTSLSYICYRCLYGHESIYSFDNALQRLSAASQDLFDDAVRLEGIFLRYEPKVVSSDSCTYIGLVQDQIATQLLGQQWSDSTPMVVREDGNCLFNAISLVLFGHENGSSEIRLKTFSINQSMLFPMKTISQNYEHCTEW